MFSRLESLKMAMEGFFALTPANAWLPTVTEDPTHTHLYATEKCSGWRMMEFFFFLRQGHSRRKHGHGE